MTVVTAPSVGAYLIVTGDVEIGPGRFARGVCRSSPCESREAAQAQWDSYVERGLYEEPFETYEIRDEAPTLGSLLTDGDDTPGLGQEHAPESDR